MSRWEMPEEGWPLRRRQSSGEENKTQPVSGLAMNKL